MSCKNPTCVCTFQTVQDVENVIDRIEAHRHYRSLELFRFMNYGYATKSKFEDDSDELYLYLGALKRHRDYLIKGYTPVLTCKEVSVLFKEVNDLVNLTECSPIENNIVDVTIDDAWAILHPDCVPKQRWETCVSRLFPTLQIKATPLTPSCENIVVELIRNDVFCDLVVEVQKQNFSEEDCQITFDLLKEEIECDITFDLYKQIIDCGVTPELVKCVIDCDLTWSLTNEGIPCIIDADGGQLKLTDLDGLDIGCLV